MQGFKSVADKQLPTSTQKAVCSSAKVVISNRFISGPQSREHASRGPRHRGE